jgi:hypothetical protein
MAYIHGATQRHDLSPARRWSEGAPARSIHLAHALLAIVGVASWQVQAGELEGAFDAAKAFVAPINWTARLEIVTDPGITIALAASYRQSDCRVTALKNSPYLGAALSELPPSQRRPYLEALFAHECKRPPNTVVARNDLRA